MLKFEHSIILLFCLLYIYYFIILKIFIIWVIFKPVNFILPILKFIFQN